MFFERRWKNLLIGAMVGASCLAGVPASGAETPHGLQPAADMPYIPDLGGLRARTFKNQYGQVRHLAESVVVRQSKVEGGKAHVPAGGLFYISETKEDAAPFMRDPFFVLGEHAYLVDLKSHRNTVRDVKVAKREKVLVDKAGYRLWFDFSTDHYDKPYIQLALIAPSGHWPLEFTVSDQFAHMEEIRKLDMKDGLNPQLIEYYLDPDYWYGASKFTVKSNDFDKATFDSLEYPVIDEATFSLSRPWVLDVRQEDFRWYGTKRIYAFRHPEGFLVRVTDFSGDKVLGGPQAGIIAGREEFIEAMRHNQLLRALRCDKMTLAALEATLRLYLDPHKAIASVPTLRRMTMSAAELKRRAEKLRRALRRALPAGLAELSLLTGVSRVGGGAFPECDLPTTLVRVLPLARTVEDTRARLLRTEPPLVTRVENCALLLDPRTLEDHEFPTLVRVLNSALDGVKS